MRLSVRQFAAFGAILACLSLFAAPAPIWAQGQTGGGNNDTGTGTGETGQAVAEGPLGFDAGVSLERTERATRDTGSFVGASAPTVGNFGAVNEAGAGLGGAAGGPGQQGGFFNFFNQLNSANQFNNQQNQRGQLRFRMSLGSGMPKAPSPATSPVIARQVGHTLQARFISIPRFAGPIEVNMEGGTAVLNGSVVDAETSLLAERLAMLEPGVLSVRNNLAVAPPVDPELLPTPPMP